MPYRITGPDFEVAVEPGETVLDACRRAGLRVPFGCRAGVCLKCLMRCEAGDLPPRSQDSLGPDVARRGLFLPCRCLPLADLSFVAPTPGDFRDLCRIEVAEVDDAGPRLMLRPLQPRRARRGQRLGFLLEAGLILAGVVDTDPDDDLLVGLRLDERSAMAVRGRVRGLALGLVALQELP